MAQFGFTQSRKDSQRRNGRALFAPLRPIGLASLRETPVKLRHYQIILLSDYLESAFMKMVFLLFGIAAFSGASAQQKDLFDIQKHLQKIQQENKKFVEKMKPAWKEITYTGQLQQQRSYILSNGNKVIILPLDHMPCIVPDMKQFMIPSISNQNADFQSPLPRQNVSGTILNHSRPSILF